MPAKRSSPKKSTAKQSKSRPKRQVKKKAVKAKAKPTKKLPQKAICLLQVLPALGMGGVERGAVDVAIAVKEAGHESYIASSGGKKEVELEKAEVPHIRFGLNSKNPLRIMWNIFKLKRIIQEHNINIVHARSRAPAWSAYIAAKWCGVHFVTTFHGTYSLSWFPLKRLYNSVMTKGERVIAISNFIKDHITEAYRVPEERIAVIHRGVDMKQFDPKKVTASHIATIERYWQPHKDFPVIFMPGRLTRWKGHLFLLEALKKLPDHEFICIFMGKGGKKDQKYIEQIKQRMGELGLRGNVSIVDPGGEMPAAYMRADVVVSASQRPEAFGRVAVEGQAMGVPVIATNLGGSKETIIDGKTGRVVEPGDSTLLARLIEDAIDISTKEREALGKVTRAHVKKHFALADMIKKTLALYNDVLG